MKTRDKNESRECVFSLISNGDVFKFNQKLYMKIKTSNSTINCVNLADGETHYFNAGCTVEPIDGEFVFG